MLAATTAALALCVATSAVSVVPPGAVPSERDAATAEDRRTEAGRAFADGERAWAKGEYAEAAQKFARAQALVPHPDTLYNLGLAQRRAGDPVAAWITFTTLVHTAETKRQRREAEAERARVRREIAAIEVRADPSQHVCLDDVPLPAGERRMVKAGEHVVSIDGAPLSLRVEGGETRTLQRVGADTAAPRRRPIVTAMLGVSIGSAAGAVALGVGAGVVDDRGTARGLAFGAVAAASAAATGAIVALASMHAPRRATRLSSRRTAPRSAGSDCRGAK